MKLLFDENLSYKLARRLADIFPDSLPVRDVGLKATDDPLVWDYAKDNDFMIVSKDADMHDLSLVFGNPPKVVWVRLGNCSTRQVEELLRRDFDVIKSFYEDDFRFIASFTITPRPTSHCTEARNSDFLKNPAFYILAYVAAVSRSVSSAVKTCGRI